MIKTFSAGSCDVAVIGAGHAGIEAALAAARLGMDTVCFTVTSWTPSAVRWGKRRTKHAFSTAC